MLASGQEQPHQNRRSVSDASPQHPDGAVEPSGESSIDNNYKFDGKDPFGDESLWQLPLQLVRDLAGSGAPAGVSNDNNNNNYNDNELRASHSLSSPKHSSGSSLDLADEDDERFSDEIPSTGTGQYANIQPEVGVSAADASIPAASSGDLKTAAGYHYPHAEHAGYHGDHHGGHYGAHHHAASGPHGYHYGKYYQ